jgi:fluoroquinolone transport system permease protein
MNAWKAFTSLGPVDVKSIRRDELLRWMALLPVVIALALRFLVPVITAQLLAWLRFDLSLYYPLLVSMVGACIPLLMGSVIGFLLLDQRDDNTLTALLTTPLSLPSYFAYRVATPILLSLAGIALVVPFSGLVRMSLPDLLLFSLAAAPMGAIIALALPAFAQNKVQGFALTKSSGVIHAPPLIAYFFAMPAQLLFGLCPTYWPVKLFWALLAGQPYAWVYFAVSLLFESVLLYLLLKRFDSVMHR